MPFKCVTGLDLAPLLFCVTQQHLDGRSPAGKLNTLGNQEATFVLSLVRSRALPASRATIGAHGGP